MLSSEHSLPEGLREGRQPSGSFSLSLVFSKDKPLTPCILYSDRVQSCSYILTGAEGKEEGGL